MISLFSIHIPDQILQGPWWVTGWIVCVLWIVLACRNIEDEEIPQIGLFSAVFFLATLFHLPLMNVHLVLPGILGIFLGKRVILAIVTAMLLQAGMGHGGFTTVGINSILVGGVATLSSLAVGPFLTRYANQPKVLSVIGFLLGMLPVCILILLHACVLAFGGVEDFRIPALASLVLHLPVALAEGVFLAGALPFLAKAKSGPFRSPELPPQPRMPLGALIIFGSLLVCTEKAEAVAPLVHNLRIDWKFTQPGELTVEAYYDRGVPFTQGELRVKDSDGKLLVQESKQIGGRFVVKIGVGKPPLDIYVQADDHVAHALIPKEAWNGPEQIPEGSIAQPQNPIPSQASRTQTGQDWDKLRDVALGLSLILSIMAFWMAWRALKYIKNQ